VVEGGWGRCVFGEESERARGGRGYTAELPTCSKDADVSVT